MVKSPEYPHIDTSKFGPDAPAAVVFTFNPEVWIPDEYWAQLMRWPAEFVKDNSFAIRYKSRTLLPGNIFRLGEGSVYYPKHPDPIITPVGFRPPPDGITSEALRQEFARFAMARVMADKISAEPVLSDEVYKAFRLEVFGIPVYQPTQWEPAAIYVPGILGVRAR